jgi:hypothetical protein
MKRSKVLKEMYKELKEFDKGHYTNTDLIFISDLLLSVTEKYMTPEPHVSKVKLGPGIIIDRVHREWETE